MLRFRITAATYAMTLIVTYTVYVRPFGDALDAFALLLCMALLAGVALWPRSRDEVEAMTSISRRSWADRVDLRAQG